MIKETNKKKNPVTLIIILTLFATFITNTLIFAVLLGIVLIYIFITKNYITKVVKGSKAYKNEDYDTALKYYRKAVQAKNVSGSIISGYLLMELKKGDIKKAEKYVNDNLTNRSFNSRDYSDLLLCNSIILWKVNKHSEAIDLLKSNLADNRSTVLYETLSSYLLISQRLDEAKEVIEEGLEFNDSSKVLKSNHGEYMYLSGDENNAFEIFKLLVTEEVNFMEPYYYTGICFKKNKNYSEATNMFNQALNKNDSLVSFVTRSHVEKALESLVFESLQE